MNERKWAEVYFWSVLKKKKKVEGEKLVKKNEGCNNISLKFTYYITSS